MVVRQFITVTMAAFVLLMGLPHLIQHKRWGEIGARVVLTLTATILLLLPTFYIKVMPLLSELTRFLEPWGRMFIGRTD